MPMSADKGLQDRLLKEIYELNARRWKLEDAIRSLDAVNNSLQEAAALRDIDAHKSQRPAGEILSPLMCFSTENSGEGFRFP